MAVLCSRRVCLRTNNLLNRIIELPVKRLNMNMLFKKKFHLLRLNARNDNSKGMKINFYFFIKFVGNTHFIAEIYEHEESSVQIIKSINLS